MCVFLSQTQIELTNQDSYGLLQAHIWSKELLDYSSHGLFDLLGFNPCNWTMWKYKVKSTIKSCIVAKVRETRAHDLDQVKFIKAIKIGYWWKIYSLNDDDKYTSILLNVEEDMSNVLGDL